jgi:hypothetical protein
MEKFDKYISEIKTLKVKSVGRFIDLDHYSSIQSGYPAELASLQMHALSDLRMLLDEKIQCHLTLLHQLEELFSHFDQNYPELFMQAQNGSLLRAGLFEYLNPIFDNILLDDEDTSVHSVIGIYSIILTKHNSIVGFINKTEDLLLVRSLREQSMNGPATKM